MTSIVHQRILKALFLVLKPLARLMLSSGIGFREFREVAKAAFVHEASVGYGVRGRETNMSRVAIMTGLSRREVKKVRQQEFDPSLPSVIAPPASQILGNWHNDPRFLSDELDPRDLAFDGEKNSFTDLVKLYAGDIPPGAMRTELLRVAAIEQLQNGLLRAVKSAYVPTDVNEKLELGLKEILRPALETLANNCDVVGQSALFYQRVTGAIGIEKKLVPQLRSKFMEDLEEFGNHMDSIATSFTPEPGSAVSNLESGVGLYYYEVTRE